jgi:mRNA-degrading endonuclease YafQ of YafQ-DinJ toxin-antitoxin module
MSKVELGSALVKTLETVRINNATQYSKKVDRLHVRNSYLVGYLTSIINCLTENDAQAEEYIKDHITYIMSEIK